ncbi:MAG TPA: aldo/keto reductase [Steroidobacteraceae bacterium]|jgi:aryl-alcohol dehydrogenase-like predicted oxidoreductase
MTAELTRRALLAGSAIGALAILAGAKLAARRLWQSSYENGNGVPSKAPATVRTVAAMTYRRFGATGLEVSEIGFGAWGIGSQAYGAVAREDSLRALARAEELGCNFVDTAMVYGDSELVLGEFLKGRRSRWIVASKYSYQPGGMAATLEQQLRRLGTDIIDYYQLHSMPEDERTFEELFALKKAGKVRFAGVSLYSAHDIDRVLAQPLLDGIQVRFSLLDPDPFLRRVAQLKNGRLAVLVRSTLKEGFLTGKFRRDATFPDPHDQRHRMGAAEIAATVDAVERFRFLEPEAHSMVRAALAYPLSFPEVSSVLLGTKNEAQAQENFATIPGARLTAASLERVRILQEQMDLGARRTPGALARRLLGRF